MKKQIGYILSMAFCIAIISCEEESPGINFRPKATTLDTTYMTSTIPTAQAKEVLLEDVTGVSCPNCPEAAVIAAGIVSANPGRVNVMGLYNTISGTLVAPVNHPPYVTRHDFRSVLASEICQLVAVPGSLPSGYINRKVFTGKTDPVVPREEWVSSVNEELALTTPVNIELDSVQNNDDGTVSVDVKITYTAAVTNDQYLSVAILEDSIVDVQEKKGDNGQVEYIGDYVHKHVFIDMFTASTGDLLNTSDQITLVPGRVFLKRFTKKVTPFVDVKKLKVLAFVHEGPATKYVLQSKEADVE